MTILEALKSNQFTIGAITLTGGLLGYMLERDAQGNGIINSRRLKAGSIGAVVGFGIGSAIALTKEAAAMSGKPAWGIIGGATGFAGGLGYEAFVKKNPTGKTLITTAAIAGTIGGGIGTAISVYQKTK